MPATKNNKNNPAGDEKPSKKRPREGALPGSERERWKAARTLRELIQPEDRPKPPSRYDELDEEMVLDFLVRYQDLGQALVRAGFTRPGRTTGSLLPNWEQFALHIEDRFDPDSEPVLQGAVAYLAWNPANLALRNARLEDSDAWETYSVDNDMVWLAEMIQRTGNRLTDEINHMERQPCDDALVFAALFVVMAWAELDPQVARWLENPGTLM